MKFNTYINYESGSNVRAQHVLHLHNICLYREIVSRYVLIPNEHQLTMSGGLITIFNLIQTKWTSTLFNPTWEFQYIRKRKI